MDGVENADSGLGKQHFLSMSSIIESISKHSLTQWYLYVLRRKALITPFYGAVLKSRRQAHKAYRILNIISACNTVSKCICNIPWSRSDLGIYARWLLHLRTAMTCLSKLRLSPINDDTVAENWPKNYQVNRLQSLQSTHLWKWKWPVVKYKHIKIKSRICVLLILCLT